MCNFGPTSHHPNPSSDDTSGNAVQAFRISSAGVAIAAAAMHLRHHWTTTAAAEEDPKGKQPRMAEEVHKVMPMLRVTEAGRVEELESFAHYAGRQIGFENRSECPSLGRLARDYLLKAEGCEDRIYAFFGNDPNPEALCLKLIDELDKCILGYFAFHWNHTPLMISQALTVDTEPRKKLKHMVMEATRKMRFERITRSLKVTRVFSTLLEEMKAIGCFSPESQRCTEVMVAADRRERSPVLLLMGGGMGAGKSTVLKDILKEPFWSGTEAVVVEADAFKETDVIYRALSSRGHHNDMLQTAELVHQSSTNAASSLLVTALNEGRDVIMDGTLSWEPFVKQTIAMARDVHRRRYHMGVGYKVDADDDTVIENYWEPVDGEGDQLPEQDQGQRPRKPYRIEIVGVICNAHLAVVRGLRRAILQRRAVRVKPQLNSHKSFASAFRRYCKMVDHARLYSTNAMGAPPKLIAWKDGSSNLLVDPEEIDCLKNVSSLNVDANSVCELHLPNEGNAMTNGFSSVWDDVGLSVEREALQKELKTAILAMENITVS